MRPDIFLFPTKSSEFDYLANYCLFLHVNKNIDEYIEIY